MKSFLIPNADGSGSIEFFERTPVEASRPLERYKVRIRALELDAVARVYAGSTQTSPAALFAQMAANPNGWQGEIAWDSDEGEFRLRATMDRGGHVALRAVLRSGPLENDWVIHATITTEAGRLAAIAREAHAFFG